MAKQKMLRRAKRMYLDEKIKRDYHRECRVFNEVCRDLHITKRNFEEALDTDICALSTNEYEIGDTRDTIEKDNESLFLNQADYETYKKETGK